MAYKTTTFPSNSLNRDETLLSTCGLVAASKPRREIWAADTYLFFRRNGTRPKTPIRRDRESHRRGWWEECMQRVTHGPVDNGPVDSTASARFTARVSSIQPHPESPPPSEIRKVLKMTLHTDPSTSFVLFCSRSSLCRSRWLKVVQRNSFVSSRSSTSLASVTPNACLWWVWTQ